MKLIDRIATKHVAQRMHKATTASKAALEALAVIGHDAKVIGSLATGRFMRHSDVDFLIRDAVTNTERIRIERIVGRAFAGTGVPYDIIHKCDLVAEQAEAFENGTL